MLEGGSIWLSERGDSEPIKRHPNFRIFACMNPPNDVGKKELAPGLRNRFTEFYVPELDNKDDLRIVVAAYLNVTGHDTLSHLFRTSAVIKRLQMISYHFTCKLAKKRTRIYLTVPIINRTTVCVHYAEHWNT